MATNEVPNSKKFKDICLKLLRETPAKKLKQLKFLLQDVVSEINIGDERTFLDLIKKLQARRILRREEPGRDEALFLCELFDAVSLRNLSEEICSQFSVERDPSRQMQITPFRKFLVKLSEELDHSPLIDKLLKEFLEGHENLRRVIHQDVCSLDVLQAMVQACLISVNDLTMLEEMVKSCLRNDLLQRIKNILKEVPYGLRYLPRDIVTRASEENEVLDLLRAGNNSVGVAGVRSGDVIGIRGMGGIGKTVLAQSIAWKVSSEREVIWLDIGQNPDCLALINALVKALGGTVSFNDIRSAKGWVQNSTIRSHCLVILDDVWSVDDANVFDCLSGNCQLLITTRNANAVRGLRGSALYELKVMPKNKSRTLLYNCAQVTNPEQSGFSDNMQRIVYGLLEECGGLPLALSLVGSNLTDKRAEQDWQDLLDDLKNADFEYIRSLFPKDVYPYDSLLAAIDVSFRRLEKREQDKFVELAIFPENTNIPSDILELFWSSQARKNPCSDRDARRVLDVLERKSLIQKVPTQQGNNSYRVHDILLDFARGSIRDTINDVRCLFLKTLRSQCVNGEWPKFRGNTEYYFKYLPYHLYSSEQHEELLDLFFDFHWLEKKVKVTDMVSLISDFCFLDTALQEIKILKSSLMLSAGVIEKQPESIGQQLLGRLLSYTDAFRRVNTLVESARETCRTTCHLVPIFSCLGEPVGPLIKIMRMSGGVFALATCISLAKTCVISALTDCSIKINELETGGELQVLKGHTKMITCLALSHSGTKLASGSWDSTTRLWEMDNFELQFVLHGEGEWVNAVEFSVDDQRVFTGSRNGQLRVWDVVTGELLRIIPNTNDSIVSIFATMDGLHLVTSQGTGIINLWHAVTLNHEESLIGHTDIVHCVVATCDSRMLVSGSQDEKLKIWDLQTYQEIRTLHGHVGNIFSVAVSKDTKYILSGGGDKIMRLWCFHTGKLLFSFEGHIYFTKCVSIIPDGSKALSGSVGGTIRVWNLDEIAYSRHDGSRKHSEDVIDIALAPDGSTSVSSSMDGTLKIWDCASVLERFTLTDNRERTIISISISNDGLHVVSLTKDSLIKVWELVDGKEVARVDGDKESRLVRFTPSGELVIIGCENELVFIWDWKDSIPIPVPVVGNTTMAIACDGNVVYTCSKNNEVCQIDLGSLQASVICKGPNFTPMYASSGDIHFKATTGENLLLFWAQSILREVINNADHPADSLVTTVGLVNMLRNDTNFVFVDEDNRVELKNLSNNDPGVVLCQPAVNVSCVSLLGSKYILLGCVTGEVLLFSYPEGVGDQYKQHVHDESVSQVEGHSINDILLFASGSANGSVKFWLVNETAPPEFTQIWSFDGVHSGPITALAVVPDCEDIVCGSVGDVVRRVNSTGIVSTFPCGGSIAALRVDGNTLVVIRKHDFQVFKWDLNSGMIIGCFSIYEQEEQVSRVYLASDDIVTKGWEHSLLIWNPKTGLTKHRLFGHTNDIQALAFVPGGDFLLSGSRDKTLKLWDLRTGRCLENFQFECDVLAIDCASNGNVCVGLQGGQVSFFRFNKLSSHSGQIKQ